MRFLGRLLPYQPGSETWRGKTLAGISAMGFTPPYKMSETYRTNIKAKSATTTTRWPVETSRQRASSRLASGSIRSAVVTGYKCGCRGCFARRAQLGKGAVY